MVEYCPECDFSWEPREQGASGLHACLPNPMLFTVQHQLTLLKIKRDHIQEFFDDAVRNGATIRDRGGFTEMTLMERQIEYLEKVIAGKA